MSKASDTTERSYGGRSVSDRRAERRERFWEAGVELFGTIGFTKTTVAELCSTTSLSRRQFYELYDNREDLLLELYEHIQTVAREAVSAAVVAEIEKADDGTFDLPSIAHAAMTAYMSAVATDPRWTRISFIEVGGIGERVEERRRAGREVWAEFFVTTVAAVTDRTPAELDYAATAFIGALTHVVFRWGTSDPRPPREEIVDLLTHLLISLAVARE
ncbi:putative TetR family transcriptional regulator [Gordonia araii NBRC 100433]|uniref:Putative TetR family transcriptional regulator n=1 Tax=Gordonia araii NBRC 100433 TaxID=1073574 RepID=G7H1Y6_9ACTN|nr:TetR/AcrR family transcriptional regulator [Gordonia araii]NNG97194.1 TetR/AcrR family transcriptional regulator [Gordonia araii NBRC 100433]GAB09861.1 putative TetR family transcriptional regulator [Gordonia araii NBRC 100433]